MEQYHGIRMVFNTMGKTRKEYVQSWRYYFYYFIAVCPSLRGTEP